MINEVRPVRHTAPELRPFYFFTNLWGDKFRNQFLDFCLPVALAPGNIPAVAAERECFFLIATTSADWELMNASEIFQELARYVTPIFIDLPEGPPGRHYTLRSVDGKKLCLDYIFEKRSYGIFIAPDQFFADGCFRTLHELAKAGVQVVINGAHTSVQDDIFYANLKKSGLAIRESARSPISIKSRELVSVALRSMHSMWKVIEWDAPYYWGTSCNAWWRVKDSTGMVMLCIGSEMTLTDYGAITKHDSSVLYRNDAGTDGDYTLENFSDCIFYVVRDSDMFYTLGVDQVDHNHCEMRPVHFGQFGKGAEFRAAYNGQKGHQFNWLQKGKLFAPIRVHSGELKEEIWREAETRSLQTILRWVSPPRLLAKTFTPVPPTAPNYDELDSQIASIVSQGRLSRWFWQALERTFPHHRQMRLLAWIDTAGIVSRRLILAATGDSDAIRWCSSGARKLAANMFQRFSTRSRPKI
jgi:hypothetical protein